MTDTDNLRTASLYINNQLLSRGLLRDGDSIDFARTRRSDEQDAEVSARIISMLNDLILRRDRDAELRESLSMSMRTLCAENLKLTADVARLTDKHADAQRKVDLTTAAESTLKTQLKSAEAQHRTLKEEVARMRSLVAQSRASCATEIRRRDRRIDTLKKQLGEAGRSRGTRGNPAITTITVTGEAESTAIMTSDTSVPYESELGSETNATLANLARLLTEENDAMLGMMQRTMAQLRDMSGWVVAEGGGKEAERVCRRATCEDMVAELDSVMDHMREILTNPSFVPIEEVVTREEEIDRLKRGWVKMENRWKEAVRLMDGWRKAMAVSGKAVCDEDLQMGIRLSPVRVQGVNDGRMAADHGLAPVEEEAEENAHGLPESPCRRSAAEENAHGLLKSPCRRSAEDGLCTKGGEELGDGEEGGATDHDEEKDAGCADRDGNRAETCTHAGRRVSLNERDEPLKSVAVPERPPRPRPSPLRSSTSAGNRGFAQAEKPRPRPSECSTRGDGSTHPRGAPAAAKSMRSMPVRPRGASSQTRLPSTCKPAEPAERARSPSRTSPDEALLARDAEVSSARREGGGSGEDGADKADADGVQRQAGITTTTTTTRHQGDSGTGRHPLHGTEPTPAQSPVVAPSSSAAQTEKAVAAPEKEADAARVRAKLAAARGSTRGVSRPVVLTAMTTPAGASRAEGVPQGRKEEGHAAGGGGVSEGRGGDGPGEALAEQKEKQGGGGGGRQPEERKRDRKMSRAGGGARRRSTLSPWELRRLISGERL